MTKNHIRGQKGGLNLALIAMIAVGVTAMSMIALRQIDTAQTFSNELIEKKRSLFAAEGGIRIAQKLASDYLLETSSPTSEDLVDYIKIRMKDLKIARYDLSEFDATIKGGTATAVIPSGPFSGMSADQSTVRFDLTVKSPNGRVSSSIEQESILGSIRLFQFFLFSDHYVEWNPGPPQTISGRVHINDNICLGGSSGYLSLEKLTAAGRIFLMSNPKCHTRQSGTRARFKFGGGYQNLLSSADSGCTNCGGTGFAWQAYALNRWGGNVQDIDHAVQVLRLPGTSSTTPAQKGRDIANNPHSNNGSMRLLVDPVLNGDPANARAVKLASLADIRIVNGTWYLKDPGNPLSWPGVPIWSDHPGEFSTEDEEGIVGTIQVGQSDLQTRWAWPTVPRRFSHYGYDSGNRRLFVDGRGVVSYGNLRRDASGADIIWKPGHWSRAAMTGFCPATETCTNCSDGIMDASIPLVCSASGALHPSVGVLNATRGGFLNGHARAAPGGSSGLAHQLPVNFDVDKFQDALLDTSPGELGSYFGAGRFMDREFNGIVYITNTWQGSLRGIDGSNYPTDWPIQGNQPDASQPPVTAYSPARIQRALPFPLCSGNLGGQPFADVNGGFNIPKCDQYSYASGPASINARPNVVRIINGKNLRPAVLPKGFTIATSLPAYVLGEYNTNSDTSSALETDWTPAMIAGDFISHLSNAWDDTRSVWNNSYQIRRASPTTYNHAILAGYTIRTATSGSGDPSAAGLNTFTRYNEDWSGQTHTVNGSMVIGFTSIHFHFSNECCSVQTYQAPSRNWSYDEHFKSNKKQPPGTPSFFVYSVKDWHSGETN